MELPATPQIEIEPLQIDQLLTLPQVLKIVPVTKATLINMRKDPNCNFPDPKSYGNRRRFYLAREVKAWVDSMERVSMVKEAA